MKSLLRIMATVALAAVAFRVWLRWWDDQEDKRERVWP